MRLFDTHAHLDQEDFDADRRRCSSAPAGRGGSDRGRRRDRRLQRSRGRAGGHHDLIYAAVGIQPNHAAEAEPGDWDQIVALAERPRVVAVGETGLDRYWDRAPLTVQQDYFDRHLRLSQARGLPFIVHTRQSDADVLEMLREARGRGELSGVMHSFTGTAETAAECVALGLYISFAGMVTFKKSDDLRAVAATIPADRILVETDSPYLSPEPRRGSRNEPANVAHTAACLAEVRGVTAEEFAAQTTENARKLFGVRGTRTRD